MSAPTKPITAFKLLYPAAFLYPGHEAFVNITAAFANIWHVTMPE
jgi:hypothetical protein